MVLDLSHQCVEGTLLALVSRGWVSMGLGPKARQQRTEEHQPHHHPYSHTQAAPWLPVMGTWHLWRSPQGGPEFRLPAGEASGRREAGGDWGDPLPDIGLWPSQTFHLS